MIVPAIITAAFFLWVPMFADAGENEKTEAPLCQDKDSLLLTRMKNVRIVLKDGTIRKNCKITAIKEYWIEYIKDGSLHDLLIESIERIEIQDGKMNAVFFDEKKKPIIGSYVY